MHSTHSSKTTNATHLVNTWLADRQTLIVAFNNLCSLRPFAQANSAYLNESLQEFCALLVDYLSLGHFEIYEHISDSLERCSPQRGIPERVLQCIMNTTVNALDFNDKYQHQEKLSNLEADLSALALCFAQRLEWEDQLIASYQMAKQASRAFAKSA
ncbi:MAG: Rsd/AlgQ family anti-sigma factor [Proteobacteria bacterium]|nr:Rsd/AlgQ family anti-sigma factor [Pseudomonadota bacterium]